MTDFDAIESTAETIRNRLGNPTVLINNAGIGNYSSGFDCLRMITNDELRYWKDDTRDPILHDQSRFRYQLVVSLRSH